MKLKDNLSNKLSAPNQGNDNHLSEDKTNAGDFKGLLNQLAVNKKRKSEKKRMEKYFDSLYFSIVTGCLLGYGDVYPLTTKCKFTSMIQALLTIIIIVA